jgi:hypothetical protein
MLPPHIKRKKCKKKFYSLPHENTRTEEERKELQQRKKRKKRKEEKRRGRRKKEEGRPQCRAAGHRDPPLGLAGRGSRRPTVFFFFPPFGDLGKDLAGRMKPTAGSRRKVLARHQTPRGRPTGHRDPRLGLAGRGFGFFFFFFPSDLIFFFWFLG